VLVETEWVLRSLYHWDRKAIADVLSELADLPNLTVAPARLRWAIERFAAGADFADMIHLAAAEGLERFVTFDRGVARKAGRDTPLPIETLGKR
jgi:predicted nucleic-acid-binding protein